ncbi:hypothetical protein [Candidatus Accumulibacter vicinus]|uniref:Uncharacterized protein n=1 Tax=Candidatus Accumulibacter vicinus TaxID=2954382 RepID=A0A084XWM8_9PROT|nr:hypothetical protein [Candidatus Accumulibacter vicinus]KFB66872.1 MAG: hypothetical protein CAPSK01_003811 [Candidatus Accumulibacter vicinus]
MKVMMVMEDDGCALLIRPEDEEGRALLAAFGVAGEFKTRLGSSAELPGVSAAQVAAIYERVPATLD